MRKSVRTIVLAVILSLVVCAPCFAKIMRSQDGRFSVTTSDRWYYANVGSSDSVTDEVLTVGLDRDTAVSLKKSNVELECRSLRELSYAEKSEFRDIEIRQILDRARQAGFDIRVDMTNIYNDSVEIGCLIFKDGKKYYSYVCYVVKDHIMYKLGFSASVETKYEAFQVFSTLTADGVDFTHWIK